MSNSKQHTAKSSRVPSRRDQEIYNRAIVRCEPQRDIAKELGLSPGRISQIVARVRRWLACASGFQPAKNGNQPSPAALDAAFSALEQQRLQRRLAQSRQVYLYEISVREINRMSAKPTQVTIRTESKPTEGCGALGRESQPDNHEAQSETCSSKFEICNPRCEITKVVTTARDQPLNVQLIKTAQRSAIELQKLAELDPLPPPEIARDEDRRALAEDLLTELLDDAVASKKVRSVWDERVFVKDLLSFLLGEPHRGTAVNIIAADAEHGRLRDDDHPYSCRDQMLVTDNSNSVPGSSLGPNDLEAPASVSEQDQRPRGTALNNAKPLDAAANARNGSQPSHASAPTLDDAGTSNATTLNPEPPAPNAPRQQKSQNLSAPPFVSEPIRLPASAGSGSFIVIHSDPRHEAPYNSQFDP